jgi:hypothetical protein
MTITFAPRLGEEAAQRFVDLASAIGEAVMRGGAGEVERLISDALIAPGLPAAERPALAAAANLLADLLKQGYSIEGEGSPLRLAPPLSVDGDAEKERKRRQLHVERDAQLAQDSVQRFIRGMETTRVANRQPISALMRDGAQLAQALERAVSGPPEALAAVIDPYVQVIQGEERCELTGQRLRDIWRYFRHTWANAYKTVPGRSMMILVRDRAAEHHPVIGLAAISSAAVQIRDRDLWIGWHPESMGDAHLAPTDALATWTERVIEEGLGAVLVDDLIADGLLSAEELTAPTDRAIAALRELAASSRRDHHADEEVEGSSPDAQDWARLALTPLFRSKRALVLAELLELRRTLRAAWGELPPSGAALRKLAETGEGRRTLRRLLRKAKSDRVGLHLADITVCGAVPPYGDLLGGKLVCAMLMSPEVREAWRLRYQGTPSIIASSVAGRPITRPSELVLLTTTSLYGRSSQYNRIVVPGDALGIAPEQRLRYERLGMSEGYGTDHFSAATVDALSTLVEHERGFQRVNSVFGEGVNPRMRKIREGLEVLGVPTDKLLLHGNQRELYGVPLAENFREYLAGVDDTPRFLLPAEQATEMTERIAAWWRERWLRPRAQRAEVLKRLHVGGSAAARVELPPTKQGELFG